MSSQMARHTLLDFFEDMTSQDDLFIVHDDGYRVRQMTYREMGAAARACAADLAARGIGADDKVVVWSENRPEWVVAMWGTLLALAVLVPVDVRASADLVNKIARIVEAKLILVGAEVAREALGTTMPVEDLHDWGTRPARLRQGYGGSAEALRAKAEAPSLEPDSHAEANDSRIHDFPHIVEPGG